MKEDAGIYTWRTDSAFHLRKAAAASGVEGMGKERSSAFGRGHMTNQTQERHCLTEGQPGVVIAHCANQVPHLPSVMKLCRNAPRLLPCWRLRRHNQTGQQRQGRYPGRVSLWRALGAEIWGIIDRQSDRQLHVGCFGEASVHGARIRRDVRAISRWGQYGSG